MVSALISLWLVNVSSHPILVQTSKLAMTLSGNCVWKERVIKSIIGEVVLDLGPKNIKKFFHLPRVV